MAWDTQAIDDFVARYNLIRASDVPRNTMISQVRELLGWRRRFESNVVEDWIDVPLYRFGAPSVPGASVEYSEGDSLVGGGGWSLKVFGIGTANTTTVQVTKSHTWVASAGTCKQVSVPVKLRVADVAVYDGVRLVGRGREAQVAALRPGDEHVKRRKCRSLPAGSCTRGLGDPTDTLEALLAGDTSGAIHRDSRAWETDIANEVSVRLKKFADVSALVKVRRTRRLELSFALPSGYDYRAYLCPGATWWDRPAA